MRKAIQVAIFLLFCRTLPAVAILCPVSLVSGSGERDGVTITFRNLAKLPIRRLEFRCTVGPGVKAGNCKERNALFYPHEEYSVQYPYPGGVPRPVTVTVQSVLLMDGFEWKPSKHDVCRVLRITPPKRAQQGTRRNAGE